MDLPQLIKSRRSVRRFKPAKISHEVIQCVLELVRWTASAHNAQPWRFIVIDVEEGKRRLAHELGEAWLSEMLNDGISIEKAKSVVKSKTWDRIVKSPIVLIACLTMEDMQTYPDQKRQKAEYLMAVQSVAASIQTLLLAVHYYGLSACWICAPLFCPEAVRKALNLPRNLDPQAMIIVGHAAGKHSPPSRKSLAEICTFISRFQDI